MKEKSKFNFLRMGQFSYLSLSIFNTNNLWESASSCAFSFILSFIPVVMIIISACIGLLKKFPNILAYILKLGDMFKSIYDITPIVNEMLQAREVNLMTLFLAFWIIWMARKLFMSIMQSITQIFHSVTENRSFINQILTFAGEFLLVVIVILLVVMSFVLQQILDLPVIKQIQETINIVIKPKTNLFATIIVYSIFFIFVTFVYRFASGTKPRLRLCVFYSFLCNVSFFFVSYFITLTINVSNYNFLYGAISTLIMLMLKVYMFFILFLLFAQMIYVTQFFDILLWGEVYLLPTYEEKNIIDASRRVLFIKPTIVKNKNKIIEKEPNQVIFTKGEAVNEVFYLEKGSICVNFDKEIKYYNSGSFICDIQCILNKPHEGTAFALTKCRLITISENDFKELLQRNSAAAKKAISQISEYTENLNIQDY